MFLTGAYGIRQLLVGNIVGMYAKLEAFLVFLSKPLLFYVIYIIHPYYIFSCYSVVRVASWGPLGLDEVYALVSWDVDGP